MSEFDPYREVLSDHARGRHVIWSAWLVVLAVAVFVTALAAEYERRAARTGPMPEVQAPAAEANVD